MPSKNEIKQAHLNIKLVNRQPLVALGQKHGMEFHYFKSQDLSYLGHWVLTFPAIREILKLEKAPPSMMGFEPAIHAVSNDRTVGFVDTGSQVHIGLMSMGTQQVFTCPYTPEQNGDAEQLNRTLGDAVRTMLRELGLPKQFWSYAYKCAAYIHNRIPNSRTRTMKPLELWCGRRPQLKGIFPFGAKAIVHIPIEKQVELDDRDKLCQLILFQDGSQGYFFWDNENKKLLNSNHVKFIYFHTSDQSNKMKITNLLNKLELKLGQGKNKGIFDEQYNVMDNLTTVTNIEIPTNMTDTKRLNWDKWQATIERELILFPEINFWTLVEKQVNIKVIKTNFVFYLKQKGHPEELLYKARLVAKGFVRGMELIVSTPMHQQLH
ncbi:hypothetical protein O181_071239 [Austropuccinia psidii MF-1]|uniref:Integrase catalytic domain-containing protein n=1 Tax=Austropuccinia psidii MF-1 TaxID=1389203 RepID=A0A9Q3F2E1_9BASI|nr:hypothetical protein [Austropuccinia psidii MF-1]